MKRSELSLDENVAGMVTCVVAIRFIKIYIGLKTKP